MIIDTHMHIYDKKYNDIQDDVIKETLENGVKRMIAVGFDYTSSLEAIKLAHKYSFIYASIGLHPSEVQKEKDLELSWIKELANDEKVIAIGEIGLDYYWDKTYIELQKDMFKKQIRIANELKLPIIVHCRDAYNECLNIMRLIPSKGVLHCFSSSLEMANEFVKEGYYLGIGGVLTFKNSVEIKRVVEKIDLKYLLSETDSPYLTPEPFRGRINKPAYTKYVVDKIAEIKNIPLLEVEQVLYQNAINLFQIK